MESSALIQPGMIQIIKKEKPEEPEAEAVAPVVQPAPNSNNRTPKFLLNELSRAHRLQPEYKLVEQSGPAHARSFTVEVKINDLSFQASATSLKAAQHKAASLALENLNLPPLPTRQPRYHKGNRTLNRDSLTPTVELNTLLMKRGESYSFTFAESVPVPQDESYPPGVVGSPRGRLFNPRYPRRPIPIHLLPSTATLRIGDREFVGTGSTRQSAKHDASNQALEALQLEEPPKPVEEANGGNNPVEVKETAVQLVKSPISLVYEAALKRDISCGFEVVGEVGDTQSKVFTVRGFLGDALIEEASARNKKLAKQRAAERIVARLGELPPAPEVAPRRPAPKRYGNPRRKNASIMVEMNERYGLGLNAVSRLMQVSQLRREASPVFAMSESYGGVSETQRGRREIVYTARASLGERSASGSCVRKKEAKRLAAVALLLELGFEVEEGDKAEGDKVEGDKVEDNQVNGLSNGVEERSGVGVVRQEDAETQQSQLVASSGITATIARELLTSGTSATAETLTHGGSTPTTLPKLLRPKQQLMYLATVLRLQVQFNNSQPFGAGEFHTTATVAATPRVVATGRGPTIEQSHDVAALVALRTLAANGQESPPPRVTILTKK